MDTQNLSGFQKIYVIAGAWNPYTSPKSWKNVFGQFDSL
jgi:hypothetical protein